MENRSIANPQNGARDSCLSSSRRTAPPQKFHCRASDTSQPRAGFGTFARLHIRFQTWRSNQAIAVMRLTFASFSGGIMLSRRFVISALALLIPVAASAATRCEQIEASLGASLADVHCF